MQTPPRLFPSFASLRAFEAVARLGQVTRAAEELNLTQSAISHRLKDLERHLGVRLFTSNRNGVTLTDAGRTISINLSGIFNRLDMVLRNAAPSLPQHKLTLSVHPSFGTLWLAPRLEHFFRSHPELLLDLRSTQDIASFGGSDGVDAAIRYGPGGWPGLHATKLLDDRLILACSPQFNGGNLPRTPDELAGMRMIRDSHDSPSEWFESFGESMPAINEIVVDDPALIASAVVNRAGVALARETLLADALRSGSVVPLFGKAMPTRYGYYFVCPLARSFEPKIATFRAWLSEALSS
ncbi:LysR family transcriptional regulator, glycine cleavage system transcriptional activator [Burkholderia multivorans]